jgi:hypothetical protein
MRETIEFVGNVTVTGWKVLCAAAVLGLGFLILDRRGASRAVRAVRKVESERVRRAA